MLVDMMSGKPVTKAPYPHGYRRHMAAMTPAEIVAIKTRLNEMIEGTAIQTAGWMPGSDWTGTVFEPIYFKAANQS